MLNFQKIGVAGGVFHILVPGVYLLLNIFGCVYLFPFVSLEIKQGMYEILSNPTLGLVITIGFGYLIGVILRIFRSEYPDKLSAKFLRRIDSNAKPPENDGNRYAYERFPYIRWMERVCDRLPSNVNDFYHEVWKKQGNSRTFLNLSKLLIISEDERAANEIYSAESLCRYISGMFYALVSSTALIIIVLVFQLIALIFFKNFRENTNFISSIIILFLFLVGNLLAIFGILANYRFMRIKEVQTVFFGAYKNRKLFQQNSCVKPNNGIQTNPCTSGK